MYMAISFQQHFIRTSLVSGQRLSKKSHVCRVSAQMTSMQFPKLGPSAQKLMVNVTTALEREVGSLLNSTQTPTDVRAFESKDNVSQGSVVLRSGKQGSKIKFLLGSWIHSSLPFGPLNITTVQVLLEPDFDAPHLLVELIQTGYNSLVLFVDHLPRKDLILEPEYLKKFYEDTGLEEIRKRMVKLKQCESYASPSLFIRTVTSPTALFFKFTTGGQEELDKLVSEEIHPCVMDTVNKWLESFKLLGEPVTAEEEISLLQRRDENIRKNAVEVDLAASMPRLFGQEVTDRVIAAYYKGE